MAVKRHQNGEDRPTHCHRGADPERIGAVEARCGCADTETMEAVVARRRTQTTYRVVVAVSGVVAVALLTAAGLILWWSHSTTATTQRSLDSAMATVAKAMPRDALLTQQRSDGSHRLRTYRVRGDVASAEGELLTSFRAAGLAPRAVATGIAVVVPGAGHAQVNVEPVKLTTTPGGTQALLVAATQD
jgi:hypothetical protein